MLGRIDAALRRAERLAALLLLAGVVALVVIASVARAAGSPIIWSVEIAQLLFAWLCMFAADIAMQDSRHFGLSLLSDRLTAGGKRGVALFNLAVLAVLLAFLLWHAIRNTALMHASLVGAVQMPASYIHGAMAVGFALLLRTVLVEAWTVWRHGLPEAA